MFQPFDDFEGLSDPERVAAFARLDQKLGLMRDLGAKTLLVATSTRKDAFTDRDALVDDFKEMAKRAGKAGCRAALIAIPWAAHVIRELDAFELVEAVDSPHFGLALNSFFSLADGSKSARLRDIPGDRVFHVQMSDAPAVDFDISHRKSQFGLLPGQGGLNLASFVRVLARAGYEGPWSLARVSATAADRRDTYARDGYRALASLLDDVAQTEPRVPQPLAELPARVHATGFEFIEFAVDPSAKTTLTSVLSALSFREERNHRSKAVELWRQGAVNIVINSESNGFAAQARAENGPRVCDMGLRVRDAGQTVKRALMLGAPAFSQPVGAGELDIPAIKGVGGSVVHFIDEKSDLHRVWDIEFDPTPKTKTPQPAGATSDRPRSPNHAVSGDAELADLLSDDVPNGESGRGRCGGSFGPDPQSGISQPGRRSPAQSERSRAGKALLLAASLVKVMGRAFNTLLLPATTSSRRRPSCNPQDSSD